MLDLVYANMINLDFTTMFFNISSDMSLRSMETESVFKLCFLSNAFCLLFTQYVLWYL